MMHDPPHPGEAIRELCVDPLGLTVTGIAKGLGVSPLCQQPLPDIIAVRDRQEAEPRTLDRLS
jgi:plasmid maintenance system antidote protein VapI